MQILHKATAGTMESSDAMIMVAPNEGGVRIHVESLVMKQFGESIRKAANEVVKDMGVTAADITIEDKGALTCTLKARIETALRRGMEAEQ